MAMECLRDLRQLADAEYVRFPDLPELQPSDFGLPTPSALHCKSCLGELRHLAGSGRVRRLGLSDLRPGMVITETEGGRVGREGGRFACGLVLTITPTTDGRGKRILMRWLFGRRQTGRLLIWPDEYPDFWEYHPTD